MAGVGGFALNTIGLVADVMGIWGFVSGQIPPHDSAASILRVAVGLDGTDEGASGSLSGASGTLPSIRLWNNENQILGVGSVNDPIPTGEFRDIIITQSGIEQQATSTDFFAGDDAICIAYITATWRDGSKWGWTGDWARSCSLQSFPSGIIVQTADGSPSTPRCAWIDKDHSNNLEVGKINIYWSAFTKGKIEEGFDPYSLCGNNQGYRAWREDGGEQIARPGRPATPPNVNPPGKKSRRTVINGIEYPGRMDERLVISPYSWHNATQECADPLSWGPDFVSLHEEVYCDMDTRQTLPLCGTAGDAGRDCFDLEASKGNAPALRRRVVGALGKAVKKMPTKVVEYGKKASS